MTTQLFHFQIFSLAWTSLNVFMLQLTVHRQQTHYPACNYTHQLWTPVLSFSIIADVIPPMWQCQVKCVNNSYWSANSSMQTREVWPWEVVTCLWPGSSLTRGIPLHWIQLPFCLEVTTGWQYKMGRMKNYENTFLNQFHASLPTRVVTCTCSYGYLHCVSDSGCPIFRLDCAAWRW